MTCKESAFLDYEQNFTEEHCQHNMRKLYLKKLQLKNYRNFENFKIDAGPHPIIIHGMNGVGKTNILEAISLLIPGRGIRQCKLEDICAGSQPLSHNDWHINAELHSVYGDIALDCHYSHNNPNGKPGRVLCYNGSKITSTELAKFNNITWLTPQMNNLFIEGASGRRKFFDNIVCGFDNDHSSRIYKYEHYLKERQKILQLQGDNSRWLDIIETKLVELIASICCARIHVLNLLQTSINELSSEFPKAELILDGECEKLTLNSSSSLSLENILIDNLRAQRANDQITGRNNFGAHKTDFTAKYLPKNANAKFCSTGEQKTLLISITIAEFLAKKKWLNIVPILLLDEVLTHLDEYRREKLFDLLHESGGQYWITSTSPEPFHKLRPQAQFIKLYSDLK